MCGSLVVFGKEAGENGDILVEIGCWWEIDEDEGGGGMVGWDGNAGMGYYA